MSDVCDVSDGKIQAVVDDGVMVCMEAAKRRELHPTGKCYHCGDPVDGWQLFCPPDVNDCAMDWAHAQARKKANGK